MMRSQQMKTTFFVRLLITGVGLLGLLYTVSCRNGPTGPVVRVGTDDARGSDLTSVNINLPNRESLKEAVPDIEEQMNAWHLKIDPVATNCTNPTTVEVTQDYEEKGRVEAKLKQGCDYSVVLALGKKKSSGTPPPPPSPQQVTYDTDIKPLIAKACLQCHGAGATLPPLHNWDAVKVAAAGVYETVVVKKSMPKTGALDDDSQNLVTKWRDDGYLEKADSGATPDPDPEPNSGDGGDTDGATPPGGGTTPDPVVTYENSVKAVLDQGCATSNCHNGTVPPALNGWDVVKASAQRILFRAGNKTMPPGVPLKDAELEILDAWEKDGFKEKVAGATEADVDGPLQAIYYQNNEPLTIKREDIEGKAEFKAALKLNLQDAGRAIGLGKK